MFYRGTPSPCSVETRLTALFAGDDTVFADLGINKKDYPAVKTTW